MNVPRPAFGAAAVALGLISLGLLLLVFREDQVRRFKVDPPAVVRAIRQMSDLVSVQYLIEKVVGIEEPRQPLGSEKLLLIVQARVFGGMNLGEIKPDGISVRSDGNWVVRLPPSHILNISIDEKETRVWDRQITWWTPWVAPDPDLERQARLKALKEIESSAHAMGIENDAQRNAENTLRAFLLGFGIHNVVFSSGS